MAMPNEPKCEHDIAFAFARMAMHVLQLIATSCSRSLSLSVNGPI